MSTADPIAALFGGMEKLGPGSNEQTLRALRLLPRQQFDVIVDAGCGSGRQTLVLAGQLKSRVHAIDNYEPFLTDLMRRAAQQGLGDVVQVHCMDMKDIPQRFPTIDLLWSEGAAYNIGFASALATWRPAIAPDGLVVVSELTWLKDHAPQEVREFFAACYPAMKSAAENVAAIEAAGYQILASFTLPPEAWVEGYYDVLGPRAKALLNYSDAAVREFAAGTLQEIEVFQHSEGSYGYVFWCLQPRA